LRDLSHLGVKSVTYTGGGEPSLHPQFELIITETARFGLQQGIYTNGTRITPFKAKLMKQWFTFIYISLDECTVENYLLSKGVNQFHKAIEGNKNLVDAVGTATIGVGFLLHERNYTKYPQMIDLAKSLGVDYCQFRPTINYDQNNPSAAIEHPTWINYLPTVNLKNVVFDKERFLQYQNWLGHGYTTCYWSALQTVITPNGKVWRCVNKRGYEDALLGDLTQESFASIWERSGEASVVDSKCRVMCRGHIANQTLDKLMKEPDHANFI
jgi:MoaA/NifB/PqqE/SkfB family radical SAM enzyme